MSIKWQNNWNIEVGEIDNQHRALVEQVSHLLEACKKGDSKQEVSSVLNFLSQYVRSISAMKRISIGCIIIPIGTNT